MSSAISVAGLVKSFGHTRALDGLDLDVVTGEVHGFLGPNGAGKSTTIRVLLGLLRADGGAASLLGGDPWRDVADLHRRLAYVPGDVTLWPNLSGGEAIDLLGRLRGGLDPGRRRALLERFELDPTKKGRAYSKGNRQKVALVAALASDAELLILDEPTSGLDPLMEAVFRDCVEDERRRGRTVLLSSHILAEVEALCDRVTIIRAGRTVETGTLADLRHGRVYGESVGALTAWRIAGLAMALGGVMAILIVVRHTRGDEESGRAELIGAGVVGRHAPLAAALLASALAAGTLALVVVAGLIAVGLDPVGSLALGVSLGAAACFCAAVAAVAAQVAQTARAATGLACGVLGAAYLARAVGDAGPHWVSWLSPLGWTQQVRAFAGDRWWALLPVAVLIAACVLGAARLVARRDLGAGLLPPRPGPAHGDIRGPLELAWRLQRGALAGWAAGVAVMGAAFGSIANGVGDLLIGELGPVLDLGPRRARPVAVHAHAQAARRRADRRAGVADGDRRRARRRGPGRPTPPRRRLSLSGPRGRSARGSARRDGSRRRTAASATCRSGRARPSRD